MTGLRHVVANSGAKSDGEAPSITNFQALGSADQNASEHRITPSSR
jgi:hypothetical protein